MQLGRARLNELTQHYSLDVADRPVPEHHADALVRSRSVDFAALLAGLKREELQSICDALALDRSGREKDVLVQRILGSGDSAASPPPASPKPGRKPSTVEAATARIMDLARARRKR